MTRQQLIINGPACGVSRPAVLNGRSKWGPNFKLCADLRGKPVKRHSIKVCCGVGEEIIPSQNETIVTETKLKEWFAAFNLDFDFNASIKVVINGRQVGAILGTSGQRSKTLQDIYDTKIFVTQAGDFLPGSRQRLFQVNGKLGRCMMVLSDTIADIAEPVRNDMGEEKQNLQSLSVIFPMDVVSKLFGEAGSILKNLIHVTGANVVAQNSDHMMPMQDFRRFNIVGTLEQILAAYAGLLALCVTDKKYGEFSEQLPTIHTDSSWLPRFLATLPRNQALMAAKYTIQVGVPEVFVPRLIGKNATTLIRLLQSSGNAQIDVPRDEFIEGTDLRKVVIRGNFKDVMKAQAGMDKLIRDSFRIGVLDPSQFGIPSNIRY